MSSPIRTQILSELTTLQDLKSSIFSLIATTPLSRPQHNSSLHSHLSSFHLNANRLKSLLHDFERNIAVSDRVTRADFNRYSAALQSVVADVDSTLHRHLDQQHSDLHRSSFLADVADEVTDALLSQVVQADLAEQLLSEREEGIQLLRADVVNLRGLFGEVAVHVARQGEILNDIEHNMQQVAGNVEAAEGEVRSAAVAQRGGRTGRCLWMVLCVVGVLGVLLVVTK
jgi:hypothetical protein